MTPQKQTLLTRYYVRQALKSHRTMKELSAWAAVQSAPKGSKHHSAMLTEAEVRDIRKATAKRTYGVQVQLAKKYKVNPATINAIVARRTWKHVK